MDMGRDHVGLDPSRRQMGGDLGGQQETWAPGLWGLGGHKVKEDPNKAIRSQQCIPVYSNNCSKHINISNNSQNIHSIRTMYKVIIIRHT